MDPAVKKETGYIAVWVVLLSLVMEGIFLLLRQWDLSVLFGNLGGAANAGSVLGTNDLSGEDAYGFPALPGGERDATGKFVTGGSYAYFWTKTARSRESAWTMLLRNDNAAATPLDNFKKRGYSVRCVKD